MLLVVTLAIVGALVLFAIYKHTSMIKKIEFYEKQGILVYPGAKKPFIGNVPDFANYEKLAKTDEKTHRGPLVYLVENVLAAK